MMKTVDFIMVTEEKPGLLILPDHIIHKICSYLSGGMLLQLVKVHYDILNICNFDYVWLAVCRSENVVLSYEVSYEEILTNCERDIVDRFRPFTDSWKACYFMKGYMFWWQVKENLRNNKLSVRGFESSSYNFTEFSKGFILQVSKYGHCEIWNSNLESSIFVLSDVDNLEILDMKFYHPLIAIVLENPHDKKNLVPRFEIRIYRIINISGTVTLTSHQRFYISEIPRISLIELFLVTQCPSGVSLWNVRSGDKIMSFQDQPKVNNYTIERMLITDRFLCFTLHPKLEFFSISFIVYSLKDLKVKLYIKEKGNAKAYIHDNTLLIHSLTSENNYVYDLNLVEQFPKSFKLKETQYLKLSHVLIAQYKVCKVISIYSSDGVLKHSLPHHYGDCLAAEYYNDFLVFITSGRMVCITDLGQSIVTQSINLHTLLESTGGFHFVNRHGTYGCVLAFWQEVIPPEGGLGKTIVKVVDISP